MGLQSGEYPQTERRLASDYRMADYQALLFRAIPTMPGTCTLAARYAIYERARKAQLAQLRTLCPALPESEIAHEEEALDQAIALVESKFGGRDSAPVKPPSSRQLQQRPPNAPPERPCQQTRRQPMSS